MRRQIVVFAMSQWSRSINQRSLRSQLNNMREGKGSENVEIAALVYCSSFRINTDFVGRPKRDSLTGVFLSHPIYHSQKLEYEN